MQRIVLKSVSYLFSAILAMPVALAWPAISTAQSVPPLVLKSGAYIIVATNRAKGAGSRLRSTSIFLPRIGGNLSYALVQRAGSRETSEQEIPIRELDSSALVTVLKRDVGPSQVPSKDVLVYVHGFNNSVESAVSLATEVANRMYFGGHVVVFSWPSQASLLAYRADIAIADASSKPLIELLRTLRANVHIELIHILAHSLGNDPLIKALVSLEPSLRNGPSKIGELILCSPDVGRDEFINGVGRITKVARGVTLWASDSDLALGFARALGRGVRAGEVPRKGGPIVMPGVYTIDVSRETRLFARNHNAYSQVDQLYADLADLLGPEPVRPWLNSDKSRHYIKRQANSGSYWEYTQ